MLLSLLVDMSRERLAAPCEKHMPWVLIYTTFLYRIMWKFQGTSLVLALQSDLDKEPVLPMPVKSCKQVETKQTGIQIVLVSKEKAATTKMTPHTLFLNSSGAYFWKTHISPWILNLALSSVSLVLPSIKLVLPKIYVTCEPYMNFFQVVIAKQSCVINLSIGE